jgi:cytochrome o ubiquinol oxidase subunit 2
MRPTWIVTGSALIAAIAASYVFIAHTDIPVLMPAGPIAAGEKYVMVLVVGYAAIVVVPVWIMLFLFAWVFREGADTRAKMRFPDLDRYGSYPELVWWAIPAIIIGILSVVSWQTSHSLDPYEPIAGGAPLEVQVVALDWKWLFIYPDQNVASTNELEIPVGRPVHFTLTADAPMNSFWIPQLGGQVMVMPGMTTQLWLRADREGVFDGYSANLSGEGFASMHFKTKAVSDADFDAWIAGVQPSSTALTHPLYHELRQPSSYDTPRTYAPVFQGLYGHVVSSFMIPGMSGHAAEQDEERSATPDMPM